jgi:phosphoribosyl 1,2-cyclic phosphodiesterase
VYSAAATLARLPGVEARWRRPLQPGVASELDAFTIESIAIPHDAAAPLAFVITARATGARLGVAHDLGAVPRGFQAQFARCDALCLEANHDIAMLRDGPYPPSLKAHRDVVVGLEAERVAELASPSLRAVVLLHLSETNNTPAVAERSVAAAARRAGFRGPVRAAAGRSPELAFSLDGRSATGSGQLALAF